MSNLLCDVTREAAPRPACRDLGLLTACDLAPWALRLDLQRVARHLRAPTTTDERLPRVLKNASGFVYFVSITGITGTHSANTDAVAGHVARIRNVTDLPVAVGFGINTPEQAAKIAGFADAAVVGSALVNIIAEDLDANDKPGADTADKVLGLVRDLSTGVRSART